MQNKLPKSNEFEDLLVETKNYLEIAIANYKDYSKQELHIALMNIRDSVGRLAKSWDKLSSQAL